MDNTNDNKLYGLLGKNISYSLSPVMHNAAFRHFNIPSEYKIFDIEENMITEFFRDNIAGRNKEAGINVTVPYKVKIKELLEEANAKFDPLAEALGSVNTVSSDGVDLYGYNTDAKGFYESLTEEGKFFTEGKKIFIFGAGGAGRAICIFLALEGSPEKINVYDIDKERLASLGEDLRKCNANMNAIDFIEAESGVSSKIISCDLVINATPLGTKEGDLTPFNVELLAGTMCVYDLVYARETELIKAAREKGADTINGLGMLVNQAALAFQIWTGKEFSEVKDIMRKAAEEELKGRSRG